jgi:hypothetical protein
MQMHDEGRVSCPLLSLAGMDVAPSFFGIGITNCFRGEVEVKEVANGFAQLAAIIMILITLAVSTAALSQMASF